MLKKVEAKCKRCGNEFWKQRTEQEFCKALCRKAAWSGTKKHRLGRSRRGILGSVQNGPFSPTKTSICKPPHTPDLGAFVRAQIVAQEEEPNSIIFALPDGTKGRVWLASDEEGSKIIGDGLLWRINTEELLRRKKRCPKAISWLPTAEALRRPIIVVGRNDPVRDVDDALGRVKGFQVRLCIEAEKELQVAYRNLPVSRQQSSSSPQRQHRHDETECLQGAGGCGADRQAQKASPLFAIGGRQPKTKCH
jgi:hypothetical protein